MDFVLIVDDEPNNLDVLELLLSQENYNLSYAASGLEALNILESLHPDVILLDAIMPELDGIEVCRRIKSNPNWRHIPIIMVTVLDSKEDLARCFAAGADDFVTKPVVGVEIRARINSMLRIKKQHDELQRNVRVLESALQLREDMSRMIVHDLRNPLTHIYLYSQLLLQAQLDDKQRHYVEQAFKAGQQLRSLTDDLLMMAKLESGKITLNLVDVDLYNMAQEVVSDFQVVAEQKKIKLISDLPEPGKTILLDANLLRRVFDNLLSNALKFALSESEIVIKVTYPSLPDIQEVRISIFDQGPGISDEMRDRIFQKYEVGNLISNVPQIGLGLAFCKMAVEAHGGKIFVEPNQPEGSVFVVEIPFA